MEGEKGIILLVEDTPQDILLTKRSLKKHNVLNEVVTVRDGAEALDYLFGQGRYAGPDASVRPRVVLLDLKLPKLSGLEVLKRVREDERTKFLPVVVFTSSDEEKDLVESYRLGANAYVRKPVDFGELSEAVGRLGLFWALVNKPLP